MNVIIASGAVIIPCGVVVWILLGNFTEREKGPLAMAWLLHLFAAWANAMVLFYYYGKGDAIGYFLQGREIAAFLRDDFFTWFPEVYELLMQRRTGLPIRLFGVGSSTASTTAMVGMAMTVTGDTFMAISFLVASVSYLGKLAIYRFARESLPKAWRSRILIGIFFVPSAVFWSTGLLKEALVMGPLGAVVLATWWASQGRFPRALALLALGLGPLALVKSYILVVHFLGTAVMIWWMYARSTRGRSALLLQPTYLVLAVVVASVGLIGLGRIFPAFAIDGLGARIADMQGLVERTRGGTDYSIGDATDRSLTGQLTFAPLALITTLARPAPWEISSALLGAAAVENAVIIGLLVWGIVQLGAKGTWERMSRYPTLIYALVFVGVFSVAVGLTTSNLGTLSRYRVPMVPFLGLLAAVLSATEVPSLAPRRRALAPRALSEPAPTTGGSPGRAGAS